MPWISGNRYLTESEMQNNAEIIYDYYINQGIPLETISALLGNMEVESTINPELVEVGALNPGFGLVQWTPQTDLINACNGLGLSPYNSGDVQIQVIVQEILNNPSIQAQWFSSQPYISRYYNSGATPDMIGITGQQFLTNQMNWTPDKLAILFMSAYERPSYNPIENHYILRIAKAIKWYNYFGGYYSKKKSKFPFVLYRRKKKIKKNY